MCIYMCACAYICVRVRVCACMRVWLCLFYNCIFNFMCGSVKYVEYTRQYLLNV